MFTKLRMWIHQKLFACSFNGATLHQLYPHIDKEIAAYRVCKYQGCRHKQVVYDFTTKELRNSVGPRPPINYTLD